MKRWFWLGFWVILIAAFGAGGYVLFVPKIGHATRSEIEAALPASLLVQDRPDPEGVARYEKLLAAVKGIDGKDIGAAMGSFAKPADPVALSRVLAESGPRFDEVERVLNEGQIWYPDRKIDTLFRDVTPMRSFGKLLALATKDAARRHDAKVCARFAVLGIRYAAALRGGGGVLIDQLMAIASQAVATKVVYDAEMADGFDRAGREAVLKQLPVLTGTDPELGASIRRDFQTMFMPLLLNPHSYLESMLSETVSNDEDQEKTPKKLAGTFDPVATARLAGQMYDASMSDSQRPLDQQSGVAARLSQEAAQGLPKEGEGPELWYRFRMNAGKNTLGRQIASVALFEQLAAAARRRAAERNVVRAVILLRMGQNPELPDPFGTGNLKIDRKRRIVWSVGENGKDDGGDIIVTGSTKAADVGCRW